MLKFFIDTKKKKKTTTMEDALKLKYLHFNCKHEINVSHICIKVSDLLIYIPKQ